MTNRDVSWALHQAPMLATPSGKPDTTARFVLAAMAEVARGDDPMSFASAATLRFMTGFARKVILRAQARLAEGGLIEDTGERRGGCTVWRLVIDRVRPDSDRAGIEAESEALRAADRDRKSRKDSGTQSSGSDGRSGTLSAEPASVPELWVRNSGTQSAPEPVLEPVTTEPVSAPAALGADDGGMFEVDRSAPAQPVQAADVDALFAEFWAVFPRKADKRGSHSAFVRAVKGYSTGKGKNRKTYPPVDPAVIIAGAKRFAAERDGEDPRYTKTPSAWINGARWEDEHLTGADVTPLDGAPAGPMSRDQAREWLTREWRIGRPQFVAQRTGIEYPQADPPPDVASKDIPEWRRARARDWIASVSDAAMAALTRKAAS